MTFALPPTYVTHAFLTSVYAYNRKISHGGRVKNHGSYEMEKTKYLSLGLTSRCNKFKGKARYSTATHAERSDGVDHTWTQKRS